MRKINIGFLSLLLSLIISNFAIAQEPAGFYKSAEGKNKKDLLVALRAIVGPHTTVSYDGLWQVFKTSDVKDGYVWDMYSTTKFTPGQKQCGNYSKVGDCYNREHSFPKSWFDDAKPMYSDAYHLYPTDGKVNGQRSNHPYGECANGTTLPPNGNNKALGKLGSSTFPGYSGTVFEPIDEYKGDFARSYFYMAAAYQDKIRGWSSPMLSNDDYPCYSTWAVNLLLKWSRQDPVSTKEIDRNNMVSQHQKNRNPFIDHPELAEYVWGTKQSEGWVPGGASDPVIITPTVGQTFDMGVTSLSRAIVYDIVVKGAGLTTDLAVTMGSNTTFTSNVAILSKDAINSTAGATIKVTYKSDVAKTDNTTIKISSSEVSTTFNVTAITYDGIPALNATNITMDGFTARWVDVSGSGNYNFNLYEADGTTLVTGYPVSVAADAEKYEVTGLNYETEYKYQLTQGSLISNTVSVTTAPAERILTLIYPETGLNFNALPNAPSDPIQVEVFTEYIFEDITATVTGPFEISKDKTEWATTLPIFSEGENFYIRLKASAEGSYTGLVSISTATMAGDEVDMKGIVSTPRTFFEDFESVADGGYFNGEKATNVCKWMLTDAGFWGDASDRFHGERSVRFGKTETSSIAMNEDKLNGAGLFSFVAGVFGSDGESTIEVSYSTNGGSTWIVIGTEAVKDAQLKEFTYIVNIATAVRFKIEQKTGKRINIDDIAISDFSSVNSPTMSQDWDAYSTTGAIVIESAGKDMITIYSLDAISVYQNTPQVGKTVVNLPAGLYIVVSGNDSKKVIVK